MGNWDQYWVQQGTSWMIGRVWCPTCRIVRHVVYTPQAEIRCETCGGTVLPATGDEHGEPAP